MHFFASPEDQRSQKLHQSTKPYAELVNYLEDPSCDDLIHHYKKNWKEISYWSEQEFSEEFKYTIDNKTHNEAREFRKKWIESIKSIVINPCFLKRRSLPSSSGAMKTCAF